MSVQKEGNHEEGNGKECVCSDRACALVDPRSRILRSALAHRCDLNAHRHYFGPVGLVMCGQCTDSAMMKVKDCRMCPYHERRVWHTYYRPRNYHAIGMTHAYAYCTLHQKRILKVRNCNENRE